MARAKAALGALEGHPERGGFQRSLCLSAARSEHLEVLQWARARGFPLNERTCIAAAENGHLKVLQ